MTLLTAILSAGFGLVTQQLFDERDAHAEALRYVPSAGFPAGGHAGA
jgi:hypothetical protein